MRAWRTSGVGVVPEGLAPYQTTVSQALSVLHASNLRPGAGVEVRYDPDDPQKAVIVSTGNAPARAVAQTTDGGTLQDDLPEATCKKAPACCRVASGNAQAPCKGFLEPSMSARACQAALDGYRQAAQSQGLACGD